MAMHKTNVTTQVYKLPDDQAQRIRFLEGIRVLAAETGAQWLAGSNQNEMDYLDALEKKLAGELGDFFVEDFRVAYEGSQQNSEKIVR